MSFDRSFEWCGAVERTSAEHEVVSRRVDGSRKIARWWAADDFLFADSIALGATGKMQKNKLREQFKDHRLPTA